MQEPAWYNRDNFLPQVIRQASGWDFFFFKGFLIALVLNLSLLNVFLVREKFFKKASVDNGQSEIAFVEPDKINNQEKILTSLRQDIKELQASYSAQPACLDKDIAAAGSNNFQNQTVFTPQPKLISKLAIINFPGARGTNATDWWDVPGMEIEADLSKYAEALAIWEALLKIKDGGGKVYARLFDVQANASVPGSEIASDSHSLVRISSSALSLWPEKRTYQVQLKSLLGPEAVIEDARLKISYWQ